MMQDTVDQDIVSHTMEHSFHSAFKWNFFGSIMYECIKTIHQIGLLMIIAPTTYGLMGSVFSLIYLATKIADMGGTYTLPIFFSCLIKNKKNFSLLLRNYFIGPMLPMIIVASVVITYISAAWFPTYFSWSSVAIPFLILLETLRSFFRYLLHFSFKSKMLVIIELISFSLFVGSIWGIYFFYTKNISINIILFLHLIESSIVVSVFLYYNCHLYQTLKDAPHATLPTHTIDRFWQTRFFNFLLRLSRELFSSNVITPLFALKFGCAKTGIFYFLATLMNSLQSIVKASIGYSGNALLAQVKEHSQGKKQQAFSLVSQKALSLFIIGMIVLVTIILVRLGNITSIFHQLNVQQVIHLGIALFIIFIADFFVLLYDQFYILEEAAQSLCFIKMIEYIGYYLMVIAVPSHSITELLLRIISIRITSLLIMAYNAHLVWQVSLKIHRKIYVMGAIIVGLLLMSCFYF